MNEEPLKMNPFQKKRLKKAFDSLIGRLKVKNKFLTKIHQDKTGIVRKMHDADACFEDLFGSLCNHIKQEDINGIPTLIEKLKENNLLFPSKERGVDYIKSGLENGIHKNGFTYSFAYLDVNGNVFVVFVFFHSGELEVDVYPLSNVFRWFAMDAHRIVVPATKTLDTQS